MRVNLLLRREPFGKILAETLSLYWSITSGAEQRVHWGARDGGQRWWGNSRLNYFAAAGTPINAFEALRREYLRALIWWKRPAQRFYVTAGTRFPILKLLSDMSFSVTPGVREAGKTVVLGGNHRVRLLQPCAGISKVVLKRGFHTRHITSEIQARTRFRLECAPAMKASSESEQWIEEAYIAGTPVNRMAAARCCAWRERARRAVWTQLTQPSLRWESAITWSARMRERFVELTERCTADGGRMIWGLARHLCERIAGFPGQLPIGWTHGDLQDANIVVANGRFWVIDWESAGERFAAYDLMVLKTEARKHGPGWPLFARRLRGEMLHLREWLFDRSYEAPERDTVMLWSYAFLLEELWYRSADAAEPAFFEPGGEWPAIAREIESALRSIN